MIRNNVQVTCLPKDSHVRNSHPITEVQSQRCDLMGRSGLIDTYRIPKGAGLSVRYFAGRRIGPPPACSRHDEFRVHGNAKFGVFSRGFCHWSLFGHRIAVSFGLAGSSDVSAAQAGPVKHISALRCLTSGREYLSYREHAISPGPACILYLSRLKWPRLFIPADPCSYSDYTESHIFSGPSDGLRQP